MAHKQIHLASTCVVSVHSALHGADLAKAHDAIAADPLASGALTRPYLYRVDMSEAYCLIAPPGHGETPASRGFRRWNLDETARSGARLRREEAESVSGEGSGEKVAAGAS